MLLLSNHINMMKYWASGFGIMVPKQDHTWRLCTKFKSYKQWDESFADESALSIDSCVHSFIFSNHKKCFCGSLFPTSELHEPWDVCLTLGFSQCMRDVAIIRINGNTEATVANNYLNELEGGVRFHETSQSRAKIFQEPKESTLPDEPSQMIWLFETLIKEQVWLFNNEQIKNSSLFFSKWSHHSSAPSPFFSFKMELHFQGLWICRLHEANLL